MKTTFTLRFVQHRFLPVMFSICFFTVVQAGTYIVHVSDFLFNPSAVNANVGDTIIWQWLSGDHTTTSTSVPNGAASWDAPMNNANITFKYIITVPGLYNYHCTMHPSTMNGSITVTGGTSGVPIVTGNAAVSLFPNPSSGQFEINSAVVIQRVEVYDLSGKMVYSGEINADRASIDLSTATNGVYLVRIVSGNEITFRKIVISN